MAKRVSTGSSHSRKRLWAPNKYYGEMKYIENRLNSVYAGSNRGLRNLDLTIVNAQAAKAYDKAHGY